MKHSFDRLIAEGKLAHAYLFAGPPGSAMRDTAEAVVRALVPAGHLLDVMRYESERDAQTGKVYDISIEQTKALKAWLSLRPQGTRKVVIIDGADRLGGEAANNLLKVLEEPPAYVHFLLITSQPGLVMATIASRCQRVDFPPADRASGPASPGVTELGKALKGTVTARIAYAKKLADDPEALDTVNRALGYVHGQLPRRPDLAPVARGLMDLAGVLSEPHYNRRLAIEHFLFTVSVQNQ